MAPGIWNYSYDSMFWAKEYRLVNPGLVLTDCTEVSQAPPSDHVPLDPVSWPPMNLGIRAGLPTAGVLGENKNGRRAILRPGKAREGWVGNPRSVSRPSLRAESHGMV